MEREDQHEGNVEEIALLEVRTEQVSGNEIKLEELKLLIQQQNYQRFFSIVDINNDGRIDIKELKQLICKLGRGNVPRHFAKRIMDISDTNKDGYIDYDEFLSLMNNREIMQLLMDYWTKYVNFIVPKRKVGIVAFGEKREDEADEVDLRYESEYSCWPPAIGMITMSVIQIILFCVDNSYGATSTAPGTVAIYLVYDPQKRIELYRYVTYMFVHIGYMHLCINLLVQLILGIPLEMVHGTWRVLSIYLAGVLMGSLATSVTDPTVLLAGASGGVYSFLTAHIASIIMNWKEMSLAVVQLVIFLIVTGIDFGMSIYNRYYLDVNQNIGYEAHFAGALAGLLVGIFILRNLEQNSCETRLWWISLVIFVSFMLFAVIWNIAYPSYYATS